MPEFIHILISALEEQFGNEYSVEIDGDESFTLYDSYWPKNSVLRNLSLEEVLLVRGFVIGYNASRIHQIKYKESLNYEKF